MAGRPGRGHVEHALPAPALSAAPAAQAAQGVPYRVAALRLVLSPPRQALPGGSWGCVAAAGIRPATSGRKRAVLPLPAGHALPYPDLDQALFPALPAPANSPRPAGPAGPARDMAAAVASTRCRAITVSLNTVLSGSIITPHSPNASEGRGGAAK